MPLAETQHLVTGEFFSGESMNTLVDNVEQALAKKLDALPPVRIVSLSVYSRGTSHAGVAYFAVVEEL